MKTIKQVFCSMACGGLFWRISPITESMGQLWYLSEAREGVSPVRSWRTGRRSLRNRIWQGRIMVQSTASPGRRDDRQARSIFDGSEDVPFWREAGTGGDSYCFCFFGAAFCLQRVTSAPSWREIPRVDLSEKGKWKLLTFHMSETGQSLFWKTPQLIRWSIGIKH